MNMKWLFGAIFFCVVVGAIFIGGVVVGGSWGSGMATDDHDEQMKQIEQCLPINSAEQLEKCVADDEGKK